jgi:uncharacterized protein (TIGR00730 family)
MTTERKPHSPFFSHAEEKGVSPVEQLDSYLLAYEDVDFLLRDELRPVRLQLEFLKPELIQQQLQIHSTVVIFGSARAQADGENYANARELARLITAHRVAQPDLGMMVLTGGGPGVMEAANRGASDAGGESMGLNISLPREQSVNPYVTPELSFQFHYFAMRKMHFIARAKALVVFPGGYGTLDELFEMLTLIQTGKSKRLPVVLFNRTFWDRAVNFDFLMEQGMITPDERELFSYVDTPLQAWQVIQDFHSIRS